MFFRSLQKALHVENTSSTPLFVVLDNGYVGVNTGSAQYNLDVNGCTIYTYPFMPCVSCGELIKNNGIKRDKINLLFRKSKRFNS